jgi:hypothetical protein
MMSAEACPTATKLSRIDHIVLHALGMDFEVNPTAVPRWQGGVSRATNIAIAKSDMVIFMCIFQKPPIYSTRYPRPAGR